jgi:hypothetical protein
MIKLKVGDLFRLSYGGGQLYVFPDGKIIRKKTTQKISPNYIWSCTYPIPDEMVANCVNRWLEKETKRIEKRGGLQNLKIIEIDHEYVPQTLDQKLTIIRSHIN